MIDLTLPPLDESRATIDRYYVQPGDSVTAGQPLAVVVTTRYEWDVPATASGVIAELSRQPGDTVETGQPLAQLTSSDHDSRNNGRAARVTPLARRIATLHGIDLATVAGSGPGGRITRGDIIALLPEEARPPIAKPAFNSCFTLSIPTEATITAPPPRESPAEADPARDSSAAAKPPVQRPLSDAQRRTAADALRRESLPYAITAVEVDMSRVLAYCESRSERLMRRGIALTPLACVTHATAQALMSHRIVNSAWSDDGIILRGGIHVGVRMTHHSATVIQNATDWSVQGIARRLSVVDHDSPAIADATLTIGESSGARWSYAPPGMDKTAALTIGAIESQARVVEQHGTEIIAMRPCAVLTLAYDARVMTYVEADAFLIDLRRRLEDFAGL
jgi:2-oxoisovalerate dehydrogenase E2 component (dihydrolipoyl transacylase)